MQKEVPKINFAYIIGLFIFTLYMFIRGFGLSYLDGGDCTPNELLPITFAHGHPFQFNEFAPKQGALPYYFRNINGNIVSKHPIIPGILNIPVYAIAHLCGMNLFKNKAFLSMITASLVTSISVVFMYLTLLRISKKQIMAIFFALVYAFATCVWSVACRAIWQHGPSLLFITIALFLIFDDNPVTIPYSGLFLGLAIFNRPGNMLIALPLTIYIFNNFRGVFLKYTVLAMIPILLCFGYSYAIFGNVLSFGQGQKLYLDGDLGRGIAGLLISPSRGLFIFSPIFIFSFGYLLSSLFSEKTKSIYRYLALIVFLWLGFFAKWPAWWGGWCFGYRYLIEIIPILIIFLTVCWENVINTSGFLKVIFFICLLFSIYVHYLGSYIYPLTQFDYVPNNIDYHPERLWSIKDSELARATAIFKQEFADWKGNGRPGSHP